MTDLVMQIAPRIFSEIKQVKNILLHCHPGPDPDSFGSALAVFHYLSGLKKNVCLIAGDSQIPKTAKCLPGIENIIPKNYFEINPGDFDLFLILDSSGLNQISNLKEIKFPPKLRTVVIDHHSTNDILSDVNLIDASYPATGQIIFDLLTLWNVNITRDMAICLFLAIYSDTGGFKYERTTPDTFLAGSELVKIVPDFWKYIFEFENQNDPENIYYEALALSSVKLFFGNQVAVSIIPYSEFKKRGIRKIHTEKTDISNRLKSVTGWEIGICFVEREAGVTFVSLRTRNSARFDVAKIAKATGCGGGHAGAAGATYKIPFTQALTSLLATIREVYPELGDP